MDRDSVRFRLIAGEQTTLKGVELGMMFLLQGIILQGIISLSAEQFYGVKYLAATRFFGSSIRILYSDIFSEECPNGLTPAQRKLWKTIRDEFPREIEQAKEDALLASEMAQSERVLRMLKKLPPQDEEVAPPLEFESWIRSEASNASPFVVERDQPEANTLVERLPLRPGHLTARDTTVGHLHWPSDVGNVLVLRTKEGESEYRITLKYVPAGHCLRRVFEEMTRSGNEVTVRVGLNDLLTNTIINPGCPEQYFASCLRQLSQEPGRQKIVAGASA